MAAPASFATWHEFYCPWKRLGYATVGPADSKWGGKLNPEHPLYQYLETFMGKSCQDVYNIWLGLRECVLPYPI